MMYNAFKDSILGIDLFSESEPVLFRRRALVPCTHRLGRIRRHPTKHHEVVETYHATKMLRVKLVDTLFRIDDAPAGAGDDVEAYRG